MRQSALVTIPHTTPPHGPCEHRTTPRPQRNPQPPPPSVGHLPKDRTNPRSSLRRGHRPTSRRTRRRNKHVPHGQMAQHQRTSRPSPPTNPRPNHPPTRLAGEQRTQNRRPTNPAERRTLTPSYHKENPLACTEPAPGRLVNPLVDRSLVQPPPASLHDPTTATKRMGGQLLPSHGRINRVSSTQGNTNTL